MLTESVLGVVLRNAHCLSWTWLNCVIGISFVLW